MQIKVQSVPYVNDLLELANQLLTATRDVWNLTQHGRVGRVVDKLIKREALIRQLKGMVRQFARERKVWKADAEAIMPYERLTTDTALKSINEVLWEVTKIDDAIRQHLRQEKERIGEELQKVNTQHKLLVTYAINLGDPPNHFKLAI
jgi:hypothetical protein